MLQLTTKKRKLFIFVLFMLALSGCQNTKESEIALDKEIYTEKIAIAEELLYTSDTPPEKCMLCGTGEGSLLPLYWGQENIGIVSINTFDLAYIGINQYDDNGNLIEEPESLYSMKMTITDENRFSYRISENSNRAYANCNIYFKKDEILDIEKAAANLCADCMNRIMVEDWGGDPTGLAIINFNTREVKFLRENLLAFQFGDYYISCKTTRNEESSLEMHLLVFYCPERYKD